MSLNEMNCALFLYFGCTTLSGGRNLPAPASHVKSIVGYYVVSKPCADGQHRLTPRGSPLFIKEGISGGNWRLRNTGARNSLRKNSSSRASIWGTPLTRYLLADLKPFFDRSSAPTGTGSRTQSMNRQEGTDPCGRRYRRRGGVAEMHENGVRCARVTRYRKDIHSSRCQQRHL